MNKEQRTKSKDSDQLSCFRNELIFRSISHVDRIRSSFVSSLMYPIRRETSRWVKSSYAEPNEIDRKCLNSFWLSRDDPSAIFVGMLDADLLI